MKNLKHLILPILLVAYTNCATHTPRTEATSSLIKKNFLVIGHRGTGDNSIAPENTISAFKFAEKNNAAFELDTMFSKTGELVVIHDSDVDRTTNGKGMVDKLTLTELKSLDAGIKFSPKFKNEKIPTLAEVIDTFKGKTIIDIEIKSQAGGDEAKKIGEAVAKLIKEKGAEKDVFVTSFNPLVLEKIKETNPDVIRGQLYSDFKDVPISFFTKYMLRNLKLNFKARPDILAPNFNLVDEEYVKEYHELGYKIYPWTVNKEEDMERLIKAGVDGLITDRADIANKVYDRLKK